MGSYERLVVLLFATLIVPATCQVSPLAIDVGRYFVDFNDTMY